MDRQELDKRISELTPEEKKIWETFGCNGHFSEPVRYFHKGTYQELKDMLKQATLDEDKVQRFH